MPDRTIITKKTVTFLIAGLWPLALAILLGLLLYEGYIDLRNIIKISEKFSKEYSTIIRGSFFHILIWSLCYFVIFSWAWWFIDSGLLWSSLIALVLAPVAALALVVLLFLYLDEFNVLLLIYLYYFFILFGWI